MSERERKERAESECRLGAKLEKSGKIDAAIEAYLRAVKEYPAHKKANYRLAELYEEKGELIKSSHHMDMAMHGGPANIPKYPKKAPVKMVKVLLKENHKCCIGGEWYYLLGGKQYNVPSNVKDVLLKANKLLPL